MLPAFKISHNRNTHKKEWVQRRSALAFFFIFCWRAKNYIPSLYWQPTTTKEKKKKWLCFGLLYCRILFRFEMVSFYGRKGNFQIRWDTQGQHICLHTLTWRRANIIPHPTKANTITINGYFKFQFWLFGGFSLLPMKSQYNNNVFWDKRVDRFMSSRIEAAETTTSTDIFNIISSWDCFILCNGLLN